MLNIFEKIENMFRTLNTTYAGGKILFIFPRPAKNVRYSWEEKNVFINQFIVSDYIFEPYYQRNV